MTAVPSLARWGVSPHADLVYRALTILGPNRVADINRSLDLPREIVRSALDELYAVGGATPFPGDDREWKAAAPGDFLAALKERREREARALQAVRDILDGTGIPIREEQLIAGSLVGMVRPLNGTRKTRERIAELIAQTKQERLSMSPQAAFGLESRRAAAPVARFAALRGLASKGIFVPTVYAEAPEQYSGELRHRKDENRQLAALPVKVMIYDRRTAIIPLDPGDYHKGAWEIRNPSIVDTLVSLFLQRWERAEPVKLAPTPGPALTQRETEIVSLMAEGLTDDTIAARLNISGRSISYAVAGLMERYQVRNRFQLGLLLGAQSTWQQHQTGTTGIETGTSEASIGEAD